MPVTLQTVRYYDQNTPYHYTVDNQPLADLEQNDIALKAAIETLEQSYQVATVAGDWSTLKATFNLLQDLNKPFAYRARIWATQNQTVLSGQVASIMEYTVLGYNQNPGTVTISAATQVFRHSTGAGTLNPVFTGNGNNLELTFTGYTGASGYVVAKLERFGL